MSSGLEFRAIRIHHCVPLMTGWHMTGVGVLLQEQVCRCFVCAEDVTGCNRGGERAVIHSLHIESKESRGVQSCFTPKQRTSCLCDEDDYRERAGKRAVRGERVTRIRETWVRLPFCQLLWLHLPTVARLVPTHSDPNHSSSDPHESPGRSSHSRPVISIMCDHQHSLPCLTFHIQCERRGPPFPQTLPSRCIAPTFVCSVLAF